MSIKNILVSYSGSDGSARAVRLAATLARRYDAHLTGAFVHAVPYAAMQVEAYLSQTAIDMIAEGARETEEERETEFFALLAEEEQSLRSSFLRFQGFPDQVLARLGRTHDLIVVAQPGGDTSSQTDASPDDLALRSGRPVLIAPRGFDRFEASSGAVLAWDGERAASRAMADAMDLLEDKQRVTVLHVGSEREVRQPGQDVMEHLSRHGVDAQLSVQPPGSLSTSDIILNTCAETDAGLLVMGAYERPQLAEMILGGVTRDVVAKSHIPVLMSH